MIFCVLNTSSLLSSGIYCLGEGCSQRWISIPLWENQLLSLLTFWLSLSLMFCTLVAVCLGMGLLIFLRLVLRCTFDLKSDSETFWVMISLNIAWLAFPSFSSFRIFIRWWSLSVLQSSMRLNAFSSLPRCWVCSPHPLPLHASLFNVLRSRNVPIQCT